MPPYHLRGTFLPFDDGARDVWTVDGRVTFRPQADAETIGPPGAFILPGLVDCHVHLTMDFAETGLAEGSPELVADARRRHLASGTLLLRDIGTLSDATLHLPAGDGLPPVHAAGRFLAPVDGYFGFQQATTSDQLPAAAADQAKSGARWVKLIGDWPSAFPDFSTARLNYADAVVKQVVERTHASGARVAVHATCPESIPQAVEAGVDSVEHGVGMDEVQLRTMAAKGIAWTPTLMIEPAVMQMVESSGNADGVRQIRERYESTKAALRRASSLGVRVLAGTDMAPPGSVWREVAVLQANGLEPTTALAAATTAARELLGEAAIEEGAPADIVIYAHDPRKDPEVLSRPAAILFEGRRVS